MQCALLSKLQCGTCSFEPGAVQGWLATLLNMVVKYVTPCGASTAGDIETAELIKVCGRYITPETGQRGVPIFLWILFLQLSLNQNGAYYKAFVRSFSPVPK